MMEGDILSRLRMRGEEFFTQVSAELMSNPRFMKALEKTMETAWKGKAKLDDGVAKALKNMNIPTRTEFKRAVRRIESLEDQVADLKKRLSAQARKRTPVQPKAKPKTRKKTAAK